MRRTLFLVACFALPTSSFAQTRCVVRGALPSLNAARIAIPAAPPLVLDLEDVAAEATLPASASAPIGVAVHGALAFDATAPMVPLALRASQHLVGGALHLSPATELEHPESTPQGEARLDAVFGLSLVAQGVTVACGELRLGPIDAPSSPSVGTAALDTHRGDGTQWTTTRNALRFFAQPGAGESVRVSFASRPEGGPSAVIMPRIQHQGAWSQVLVPGTEGFVLGWVPHRELAPAPSGLGVRGTGTSGCGGCGGEGSPALQSGDYLGPAELTPGTEVRAAPDGAVWATVFRPGGYTVLHRAGSPWVQLRAIPGVRLHNTCSRSIERAFVPRSSVRFVPSP